jgi:hypothetical protein
MSTLHQPSSLDRALRLFADVRPGEGGLAVLLALDVFLILTSLSARFSSRGVLGKRRTP